MDEELLRAELHWDRVVSCHSVRALNLTQQIENIVALRPDSIAVVEGAQRLSYADLFAQAGSIAALLAAEGVGAGDRVAVMLANGVDAVRSVVAILRLGAILVSVNSRSRPAELDFLCLDCAPSAIIYGSEFSDVIETLPSAPAARFNVIGNEWQNAIKQREVFSQVETASEDAVFAILYTSGTTGKPKGAMLTHLGAIHSCLHWRDAFGLGDAERTLVCVPWAHVSGLCGVIIPFLYLGGTLVMLPEFKRRTALELAARERITHALMVPAMYGLCLLEPDLADFDLKSWRIAAYGGAPMPEPTITRFADAFPWLAMCNAYGATETTSPATIIPLGEGTKRADSIGRVVTCGDIKVMDDTGRELPLGTNGELWIAGPMVVPGYWGNSEATAASFVGGYWKSGDIGSIDAEGYVRIADRKKDMIIRGGFKVYPAEVESVLAGLDGVVEAAVVGRSDPMLGETVVAFVAVDNDMVTKDQVRDWCAERLSDYKVPKDVVIETSSLPRNANGKIQKAELRERAALLYEITA